MFVTGGASLLIINFPLESSCAPVRVLQSYNWNDGLFDVCWSECNINYLATAGGDGSIQLWNNQLPDVSG